MTPEQVKLIQSTWDKVVPIADTAATLFYDRLFELDPDLRRLFCRTDMPGQRTRLVQALDGVIRSLKALDQVIPDLEALGRRHVEYDVKDKHYETVGAALIWTLERGLADDWTAEARNAWTAAYVAISSVMRDGAKDVEPQRAS